MIKAVLESDRGQILVLGLSGENMTRLMAGEPILVNPKELGLEEAPQRVLLMGGRSEEAIRADLERQFGAARQAAR